MDHILDTDCLWFVDGQHQRFCIAGMTLKTKVKVIFAMPLIDYLHPSSTCYCIDMAA